MLGRENKVDYLERRIECHHMAIICTRNCDPLSMKKLLLKLNLLHLKCAKRVFPFPSWAFTMWRMFLYENNLQANPFGRSRKTYYNYESLNWRLAFLVIRANIPHNSFPFSDCYKRDSSVSRDSARLGLFVSLRNMLVLSVRWQDAIYGRGTRWKSWKWR